MVSILWFLIGIVLMVIGLTCAVGAVLPRDHVATGSVVVPIEPAAAWRKIRAVGDLPAWRSGITKVDGIDGPAEAPREWVEHSGNDAMKLIVEESQDLRLLRTRIDDTGKPFGGTWTFELSPEGPATRVRITERGFVGPPPFRFIAKFVMGHRATLVRYLADFAKATGATVRIEN